MYDNGENPLKGDVLPDLSNLREELCTIVYVSYDDCYTVIFLSCTGN